MQLHRVELKLKGFRMPDALVAIILSSVAGLSAVCVLYIITDFRSRRKTALIALGVMAFVVLALPFGSFDLAVSLLGSFTDWAIIQGLIMLTLASAGLWFYYVFNPNYRPGKGKK